MKGRKPTPTWLKLVAGVPGHRPLNLDEPVPEGDLVDPPPWFNAQQVDIWNAAIKAAPPGLLKELDRSVLVAWTTACDLHAVANQMLSKYGAVIKHPVSGAPIPSPYCVVARQNGEIMLRAASEMGFSPSSRSKVKVDIGKTVGNRFAELKELKLDE